jgi:hypothetical protein
MRFRVRERERASPGAAEHEPPLDPELPAQELGVGDQMPRGVGVEVRAGFARVRRAPTAVALVEEHEAVGVGIEERPKPGRGARARAAVEDDRRLAERIAAGLPVQAVAVADLEEALVVRLDFGVHQVTP